MNPKDEETRYNLALAQKLLNDQQQQNQDQQNQNQDQQQQQQEQKEQEQEQNQDQNEQKENKTQYKVKDDEDMMNLAESIREYILIGKTGKWHWPYRKPFRR